MTAATQFKCLSIFLFLIVPFVAVNMFMQTTPTIFFLMNLLIGILCWTYLEYHLHRFWTHNKNANSTKEAFKRHVHHHKHPTEIKVTSRQRMVLFFISIALFIIAAFLNNFLTIFVGFAVTFSYSFFSHWILHQTWSRKLFPRLHRFHIHHHCKYPDRCFGFTTTFWDVIFKTTPPKQAEITEKIMQFYYGIHKH